MQLIRFRLRPKTPWMTPWQADTIGGLLAALYARVKPEEAEEQLIGPWREGRPSLVVSDAFPDDLLPSPANLAVLPGAEAHDGKKVRTAAWLSADEFRSVQRGALPPLFDRQRKEPYREVVRLRNSIDRSVNSTGESGELYEAAGQLLAGAGALSVFARVEEGRVGWAAGLFALLGETGFGADTAVGAGEVEVTGPDTIGDLEPVDVNGGWVSLSTFQPAKDDPTEGYWRSFVKYGKLGPDFQVTSVFKRPQWMLRAGACFRDSGPRRGWYGHWIGTEELLPDRARREFKAAGILPGQPAYALAVPLRWMEESVGAP
jgi:CRISPR-associated protein Csm4